MSDSKFRTYTINGFTAATETAGISFSPSTLFPGAKCPTRIMVRNTSDPAMSIFLAFDSSALQASSTGSDTYEIPPGQADIFVLQPGQQLFAAVQSGSTGRCCIAVSDAFPITEQSGNNL